MPPRTGKSSVQATEARMSYDIVSIDLDGTLVDTAAEIAEAANRALESHGMARRSEAEITLLIGNGLHDLMKEVLARALRDQPELADKVNTSEVFECLDRHYADTTGTMAVAYPGAREALVQLKAAGVKLACVTNKEIRHAHRVLQATNLNNFFELTIGGDSLPQKKPHPSVLRYVVDTLGGDRLRTAHVGDSATDVAAARNAGVAAWVVPYGYNAGRPIADANPERIFPGLLQVAEYVLAGRRSEPSR